MISVVIPAHDEEATIVSTLTSVMEACGHPDLGGEEITVVLVLDSCSDRTLELAEAFAVTIISVEARNVGEARRRGAAEALRVGARWLAFTDADTEVGDDWLVQQLALRADAVCGTVGISDWSVLGKFEQFMRTHWALTYTDADGHRHIHGANLGMTSAAYLLAGGFSPLACSEDVALVDALVATGANVVWSAAPRVLTSARLLARARGGFGDTLARIVDGTSSSPASSHSI